MPVTVHFSLHFERDLAKLGRISAAIDKQRMGIMPFVSHELWRGIVNNPKKVQHWIETRVAAVDALVVLIGAQTYTRPLIRNEIAAAARRGLAMLGVCVPDETGAVEASRGEDPFKYMMFGDAQMNQYRCYDWVSDELNPAALERWLETAIKGRSARTTSA